MHNPQRRMRAVFVREMARQNEPGTLRRQVALNPAELLLERIESDSQFNRPGLVYAEVVRHVNNRTQHPDDIIMAIQLDRLRNRRGVGLNVLVDSDINLVPDDMCILKSLWHHYNLGLGSTLEELFPPWWQLWHHMEEARRTNRFIYRLPSRYDRPGESDYTDCPDRLDGDEAKQGSDLPVYSEDVPQIFYGYKKHWDDEEDGFGEDVCQVMTEVVERNQRPSKFLRRKPEFVSKNTKCTECLAVSFRVWEETMRHVAVDNIPPLRAVRLFARVYPSPSLLTEVKELMKANLLPKPDLQKNPPATRTYHEQIINRDGTSTMINVEMELEVLSKAFQIQEVDIIFETLANLAPNNYIR